MGGRGARHVLRGPAAATASAGGMRLVSSPSSTPAADGSVRLPSGAGRCLRRRPHCNEATTIDPPSRSSRTPRRARHRRRRRRRHWRRRWWRRKRREGGCGPDHRVVDCRRLWATWKPIGDLGEIFFRDRLRPWAAVMGAIGERVSGHRRTWRRCRSIAAAYKKWLVHVLLRVHVQLSGYQ